jgi:hypothetical protein
VREKSSDPAQNKKGVSTRNMRRRS